MARMEFAVGQKQLCLAMLQAEGDQRRVEADVDGIEDRADHRRRVVGFQHGRRVGGEDGDRVAAPDAGLGERVRQPPRPRVEFAIREAAAAVDDGRAIAEEVGRALEKTHRAQRHEIGGPLAQFGPFNRHADTGACEGKITSLVIAGPAPGIQPCQASTW